jgi:hypothetical protein
VFKANWLLVKAASKSVRMFLAHWRIYKHDLSLKADSTARAQKLQKNSQAWDLVFNHAQGRKGIYEKEFELLL